jgi:hypothetical protein
MKGIVFTLLEKAVSSQYGESMWDQLLDDAGLEGAYTTLGSYPDAQLMAIVGAASKRLNVPQEDVLRWFGRSAMPLLAATYPQFFSPHQGARSFVLTLNEIIHPEVRKLYPGADVPEFEFDATVPDRLTMRYVSRRRLCSFAEGLLLGAGDHYKEPVRFDHARCMRRGDPLCEWFVTFDSRA